MDKIIITSLGTISPYPKGNMNCPGFLVEYGEEKILLDCGNGITRLLHLPDDLKNLNIIITHYHKDHFGDLNTLQYASFIYHQLGIIDNKIKIYLPKNEFYFNKSSIIYNNESYSKYFEICNDYSFTIDDLDINFYDNKSHSIESYMVKLQNKDLKIIYTSDIGTTNFNDLISFCMDADLIICESSFLRKHNSLSNTHMTAYDAGVLANESRAKKLLLTHFWPEEERCAYLDEARQNFENTEIAEEGKKLILRRQ